MIRDSQLFRIEDGAGRILRNNIAADTPGGAALAHFRKQLHRRDIHVRQSNGIAGAPGYYCACAYNGSVLEPIRKTQSVKVVSV